MSLPVVCQITKCVKGWFNSSLESK